MAEPSETVLALFPELEVRLSPCPECGGRPEFPLEVQVGANAFRPCRALGHPLSALI